MKHLLWPPLLGALLLSGCTGTATDFQCNATTSDRCMTMEEANNMARQKTEGAKGKPGAGVLPALVEIPSSPVTPQAMPSMTALAAPSSSSSTAVSPSTVPPAQTAQRALFTPSNASSPPRQTEALCASPRCDALGEATPLRLPGAIATLWIAPWIDASDVFHQPGRVTFVLTPGTWQLPQQIK